MLKILIVSLKQDIVKRKIISEKLNNLKVDFDFIDAIYGKDLSETFCQNLQLKGKLKYRGFRPTRGEIGCTLSHISAFRKMLSFEDDWVCILEDDAIIDEKFGFFIHNFDLNVFGIDNIIILGGQEGLYPSKFISKSIFNKINCANQVFYKVNKSEKYVNRTCCYVINRASRLKMLDLFEKGFYLADDWLSFKKEGVFEYMYISNFVEHPIDLTMSLIEQERMEGLKSIKLAPKSVFYKFFKKIYLVGLFLNKQINRFY